MQPQSLKRITVVTVSALLILAMLSLASGCSSKIGNTGKTLQWGDSIDKGISQAKTEQKKVLLDFWGSG